ncbi:hypothetical protein [Sphingomonas sp. S2-65]|uniref:hypothetical protein n=1 Tax=Sphingomonas sp. S2-65 TaxID=2903960 RepID=UPI001F381491|nr:hypothetical protein [Sphingomonas sp. S2-65]UYY58206.1 hypothetical protein LZ586_16330 [Sphingomonas sp. S2-65]
MAYLNFSPLQGQPLADAIPTKRAATGFSALEWQVVAIAQRDGLSSLRRPGRLSMALGVVFGGQRTSPRLADERLEALRRAAVIAWRRGPALPPHEVRAFHKAGFTPEQYDTLLASISRGRAN